ncbi:hypothetical protein [Candidatus Protochlamydia phocaeensis]|uniref:hypothetical protein n=1 Tax=Candidatus Protochlamydia phocaeensis TaxID=1414722 RepID=UPI000A67531E|nr:hypothetical protein [Candidatus Protochlamydia phocaeensis]
MSELLELGQAESSPKGEGVFFGGANKDISAVHAEPKMDAPRLCFSIFPGTASDIEDLYRRWHPNKN